MFTSWMLRHRPMPSRPAPPLRFSRCTHTLTREYKVYDRTILCTALPTKLYAIHILFYYVRISTSTRDYNSFAN